ncbi:hypothetical protein ACLWNE_04820 [Thermus oshimai]|jgi:hypothetical protein|uniref:hypothetical protein n=1 Tax=Thermus oshimai TaxID=56957 RepID=UPI0039A53A4C
MLHWDDELDRRIRLEKEGRRLQEAPFRKRIMELEAEIVKLRFRLQQLEEEKRILYWEKREIALDRAFPGPLLEEAKRTLEEAWLDLTLMGSPQAPRVEELIRHLERILNGRNPRRSEREPPRREP